MATLLIIGGTGFFGKSFLDSFKRGLLERWDIDCVIALSRNAERLKKEAPELLNEKVHLLNADIGTLKYLPKADFVIHAAASSDARNYIDAPLDQRKNILLGVYNYCKLAPKYHLNSKIVYVSSGAVYGSQPPELDLINEDFIINDNLKIPAGKRDYSIAKRDAEHEFLKLNSYGLNISIARCFSFVGRWLPRDQHFAIGNFINDGLHGRPINVKATTSVFRSYMYADDLVNWLMVIAENAAAECNVFNVGSDEAYSINEIARLVANEFGGVTVSPPIISSDNIDRYVPDIKRAKKKLGLEITIDIKKAIHLSRS